MKNQVTERVAKTKETLTGLEIKTLVSIPGFRPATKHLLSPSCMEHIIHHHLFIQSGDGKPTAQLTRKAPESESFLPKALGEHSWIKNRFAEVKKGLWIRNQPPLLFGSLSKGTQKPWFIRLVLRLPCRPIGFYWILSLLIISTNYKTFRKKENR